MSLQEIADKCVCQIDDEVRRLRAENEKLKRDLDSERNLRMLDKAEVVRLRRMIEAAVDIREDGSRWLNSL